MSIHRKCRSLIIYFLILVFAMFFFFPIFWMIVLSIKPGLQQYTSSFIPFVQFQPDFGSWVYWIAGGGILNFRPMRDSLIIGIGSASIATILGSMAGYSLARYNFKRIGNINILLGFFFLRLLPPIVLALPMYIFMSFVRLYDTPMAVILAHATFFLPYAVIITHDSFRSLPAAMEESAMVDGASTVKILYRITLPIVTPALVAAFLLTFVFSWNEFLIAYVLTEKDVVTIPLRLGGSPSQQLIAIMPPVVIALLLQKYLVSSLTMGSVKA